jgi:hypothetical protein
MGMTDRQFDTYQKGLLRELKDVEKEIKKKFGESADVEKLKDLMQDTEEMLKRP